MFLLYNGNGSGSREAILEIKVHPFKWELVKRNSVRILRHLLQQSDAADTLENLPFELWDATNGFGDRFAVLYMKVPVGKYLEIELQADTYPSAVRYNLIAESLKEAGSPVRFIGMDADAESSASVSTPVLQTSSMVISRALK